MQHYATKSVSEFLSAMYSFALQCQEKKVIHTEERWRRAVRVTAIASVLSDSEGRLLI